MGRIQEKCAGCVGKTVDINSLNCYNEINSWNQRRTDFKAYGVR